MSDSKSNGGIAVKRHGHVDHLHDGHLEHEEGGRVEEHVIEVSPANPEGCTAPAHGHAPGHVHGPGCGHEAAPHGDHVDYLMDGKLHHPHGNHCDDHGKIELA